MYSALFHRVPRPSPADRVFGVKPGTKTLPVAVPQHPAGQRPTHRPANDTEHDGTAREIEPEVDIGPRQEEITEYGVVLILGNPARRVRDLLDVGPERRPRLPVRAVIQSIQLVARQVE